MPLLGKHRLSLLAVMIMMLTKPCLATVEPSTQGRQFEAHGSVQYRVMSLGATQEQAKVHFDCFVNNCRWLIRIKTMDGSGFDFQEVAFDGEQLYYVSSLETMVRNAQLERGAAKVPDNVATAFVFKGKVFRNSMAMEVGPIWLAYASTCYLDNSENGLIEPAVALDASGFSYELPKIVMQKAEWEMSFDQMRFPTRVVYFDDGLIRGYSLHPEDLKRRSPPFDHGFTNAIYSVSGFTNRSGFLVPQISALNLYIPKGEGRGSTDLLLRSQYIITLESFGTNSAVDDFQPRIPGKTYVSDFRFNGGNVVGYAVTNSWIAESEVMNKPGFQRRMREVKQIPMEVHPSAARWMVLLALAGCSLFFGYSFLKIHKTKKPQTNNEKEL